MNLNNRSYHSLPKQKYSTEYIKDLIRRTNEVIQQRKPLNREKYPPGAPSKRQQQPPQRSKKPQVNEKVKKNLIAWAELTDGIHKYIKNQLGKQELPRVPLSEIPMIQGVDDMPKADPDSYYGDATGGFDLFELSAIKKANNKYDTRTKEGQEAAFAEYPASVKKKITNRKKEKMASYPRDAPILENEQEKLILERRINMTREEVKALEQICSTYDVSNEQGQLNAFAAYPDSLRRKITAIGTGKIYGRDLRQSHQETTYIFRK